MQAGKLDIEEETGGEVHAAVLTRAAITKLTK